MVTDTKTMQRCYKKDPDIVSRKIADEVILVPIRHSITDLDSIYKLNELGARIWELVDGKRTLYQIRDIIIGEFEISPQEAERDLREFLEKLEKIGGIKKR